MYLETFVCLSNGDSEHLCVAILAIVPFLVSFSISSVDSLGSALSLQTQHCLRCFSQGELHKVFSPWLVTCFYCYFFCFEQDKLWQYVWPDNQNSVTVCVKAQLCILAQCSESLQVAHFVSYFLGQEQFKLFFLVPFPPVDSYLEPLGVRVLPRTWIQPFLPQPFEIV